jgi:hypothetical protein
VFVHSLQRLLRSLRLAYALTHTHFFCIYPLFCLTLGKYVMDVVVWRVVFVHSLQRLLRSLRLVYARFAAERVVTQRFYVGDNDGDGDNVVNENNDNGAGGGGGGGVGGEKEKVEQKNSGSGGGGGGGGTGGGCGGGSGNVVHYDSKAAAIAALEKEEVRIILSGFFLLIC